jgi:hypothetical protein
MDGTDVINQALASIIDTELVAKQLEQAFKDVSILKCIDIFICLMPTPFLFFRKFLPMHRVSKFQMRKLWLMYIKEFFCHQQLNRF